MKKVHTQANGYYKNLCHYSKTGWAWWTKPKPEEACKVDYCTCIPCKSPKKERVQA